MTHGARIVHLDLRTPRNQWAIAADGRRAFVVLWWDSVPLGSLRLETVELPLDGDAVAELAAAAIAPAVGHWTVGGFAASPADIARASPGRLPRLETLDALLTRLAPTVATVQSGQSLGVVVCTRDRPQSLASCLDALAASRVPPAQVLVVDNAPTSAATRELVSAHPGVEYVVEPAPGLSRARNTGLRACRTELVAFTDDDVVVHGEWTTRIGAAFRSPQVAAVTGLVLPASLDNESEWLFETAFGGFSQGFRPFDADRQFLEATRRFGVPVWRLGAGANMAFRRQEIVDAGGFDERLGAGAAGCSEDSEAWYRLLDRGRTIHYDPRAVVFHAHRTDVASLHRQMHLYMKGHVAALFVQFERTGDLGNLRRLLLTIPKYYGERWFRRLTSTDAAASMFSDEVKGALAGVGYYLAHRGDARDARLRAGAHP